MHLGCPRGHTFARGTLSDCPRALHPLRTALSGPTGGCATPARSRLGGGSNVSSHFSTVASQGPHLAATPTTVHPKALEMAAATSDAGHPAGEGLAWCLRAPHLAGWPSAGREGRSPAPSSRPRGSTAAGRSHQGEGTSRCAAGCRWSVGVASGGSNIVARYRGRTVSGGYMRGERRRRGRWRAGESPALGTAPGPSPDLSSYGAASC